MALFGGYEKAGVGIAKDAPQKKPFFRFWELVFRKFWKLIGVNLLMDLCILPLIAIPVIVYLFTMVITGTGVLPLILIGICAIAFIVLFGPVMAGCTQILRNYTREKPTFMLSTFGKTFRSCFGQACVLGLIDIVVAVSAASSFYAYPMLIRQTGSASFYVLFVLTLSLSLVVLMMSFYGYLMIVSTELSMKNILKNSLALSLIALKKNFLTLLLVVLVMGLFGLLTYLFPYYMIPMWLFLPTSFVAFLVVFNCYPVIQKYVINPYYAQRGEASPEMMYSSTEGENLFEDQGGREKPIEPKKPKKKGKGKVIS